MSKIALSGNASGTGTLTIAAPNTNSDRTLNLPDSAGTLATAESTLAQFNATGSAPVYACRAWVNFNGTGTVAIRASGNVSSLVDNGTGDYTVNFTTAMPDADYVLTGSANNAGPVNENIMALGPKRGTPYATGSIRVQTGDTNSSGGGFDCVFANVAIFR
jgi:hypothetical protein